MDAGGDFAVGGAALHRAPVAHMTEAQYTNANNALMADLRGALSKAGGDAPKTLKLVLMGKTGAGKTSMSRTLTQSFGEEPHPDMTVGHGIGAETSKPSHYLCGQSGEGEPSILLLDTPGLMDTRGTAQDERNLRSIGSANASINGFHAILLVVPALVKMTAEEKIVLRTISMLFSSRAKDGRNGSDLADHVVLVVTKMDALADGVDRDEYLAHIRDEVSRECGLNLAQQQVVGITNNRNVVLSDGSTWRDATLGILNAVKFIVEKTAEEYEPRSISEDEVIQLVKQISADSGWKIDVELVCQVALKAINLIQVLRAALCAIL